MSKQTTASLLEALFNQTKDYIDARLELLKLKAIDKASGIASAIVAGVALFIIFFIFFVVLNIGIALLIGDLIGKSYAGFLIWAAVYLIVGLVLLYKRKKIVKAPITTLIIRKFL